MDALTTKEWDERQRIVTQKTVQAEKDADIEATKRRAEAKTAAVQSALAPFITPGMWQVTPGFGSRITTGTAYSGGIRTPIPI